jgi:hypothetical protein
LLEEGSSQIEDHLFSYGYLKGRVIRRPWIVNMDPKGRISRIVQIILDGARTATTLRVPRLTTIGVCSLLILLIALTCFHPKVKAQGEACTYYVSTSGSDNQSGTSESQAWASFSHALGQLHPGDMLCIADGTYNQSLVITLSGTDSDPITIRALNDNQVTLENADTSVSISNSHFLTLEGITINGGRQGVYVTGSKHITLRRVYVFGVYSFGMWFKDNNDDFLITECRVENMTGSGDYGWGIRLYDNNGPGTGKGVVEKSSIKHGWRAGVRVEKVMVDFLYNVIEDWGGEGVRDHGIYYGNPPPVNSEGATTIIEGNIFRNNNHGFGLKISSWVDPINMIIRNNIFEYNGVNDGNCCDGGLSIEHGNDGIQVYNNVFYENRNHAINIAAYNYSNGKFGRNIKVKNNIFYSTNSAFILLMNDSTEGLEIDTNCYYSTSNTKFRTRINSNTYTNYSSFFDWQNNNLAPWVDEHSIFQDPKLSNPSQGDYSLQSDSPCIDKGTPLPEVQYDFNFVPRPQGNGVDIGAFEYLSTLPEDINGDGWVDAEDMRLCVNVILEGVSNPKADVNWDGEVDSLDVQQIVNAILNR